MIDSEIKNIVLNSRVLKQVFYDIDLEQKIFIKGIAGSLKSLFLSILFEQKKRPIFYITADDEQEEVIKEDLELIIGADQIAYIPKIRELAYERVITEMARKGQFLSALERLVEGQNLITITSAKNIAFKFPSPDWIRKQKVIIDIGREYNFDLLKERLVELGFNREAVVENLGEMSVRGGIIDVYPFSSDYPFRIEFFGDTVESIRIFDPTTQRSINQVSQLIIYPQHPEEQENLEEYSLVSILDYLDKDTIVFLDESEIIKKDIEEFYDYKEEFNNKNINSTSNKVIIRKNKLFNFSELERHFDEFFSISHNSLLTNGKVKYYNFSSQAQESLKGNLQVLRQKIQAYYQKGVDGSGKSANIYFLCDSANQVERIEDILSNAAINCDRLAIRNFGINQGFIFSEVGLVVFTDNQFYGRPVRWRRRKKVHRGLTLQQLHSLSIGDFVVHVDHGIGQYQGLKKISVQGNERECLSIVYRDGDFLYVPLDRMDRVQKYSAKDGLVPSLSKLGSKNWDRLKKKTKKHIKNIAKQLIELYAKRKAERGFAFSKDTLWQKELEASFEYEDTPDQSKATEEIKLDMENESPMDRLVCGDVGYGKTEVAVRAAFKATNDSKQVALLVPTTVLALQHYNLFQDRLGIYPIKVEMLSRFRTTSEQKRIVEWLKEGRIDIVIGTHRLLSKDVQFKNLGLVIVDEEHRFGVKNKERLKELQVNVDVLSMSATPIPRTLNMAMLGIRDMSLIATPPRDRLPIHTEIVPFDKKLIRLAILNEIERGGQVFFVHNRVHTIDGVANLLRSLVPEVTFAIAHGQMDERQLEKVMWNFATRKFHCLVSTMIIESGLDIPNVNTLIVNRADRFGLSQLYQLRGRVGRSTQRAYAYLLVPQFHLLNKNALKRLQIIEEFADLGSGFNIAMRDLEIRGAGNIFGAEQSGHIVALGYEMYIKIIEEAVQELKFEREGKSLSDISQKEETKVEINQDAYLPDDYIEQPELKVDIYRRLANVKDLNAIDQIKEEVMDRFGKLPQPAVNLFNLVSLKIIGNILDFRLIKVFDHTLVTYFLKDITTSDKRELLENKICSIMQRANGSFHFVQDGKENLSIHIDIPKSENDPICYSKNYLKNLI
jgi:transcription-repair coupling factor (superfamily II helicase)